jgi:hypothetical protein
MLPINLLVSLTPLHLVREPAYLVEMAMTPPGAVTG